MAGTSPAMTAEDHQGGLKLAPVGRSPAITADGPRIQRLYRCQESLMSDEKASALVRPALPRGLVDRGPSDIAAAEAMMAKIRGVYELYGFEAVETPFLEYTEALGKFLPDLDRPNEGVFSF